MGVVHQDVGRVASQALVLAILGAVGDSQLAPAPIEYIPLGTPPARAVNIPLHTILDPHGTDCPIIDQHKPWQTLRTPQRIGIDRLAQLRQRHTTIVGELVSRCTIPTLSILIVIQTVLNQSVALAGGGKLEAVEAGDALSVLGEITTVLGHVGAGVVTGQEEAGGAALADEVYVVECAVGGRLRVAGPARDQEAWPAKGARA